MTKIARSESLFVNSGKSSSIFCHIGHHVLVVVRLTLQKCCTEKKRFPSYLADELQDQMEHGEKGCRVDLAQAVVN